MSVYLDHAATSPMPQPVHAAYTDALTGIGNPASTHAHGQAASERLEQARGRIARALGADAALVTLTGGGTESINLALKGMYWAARRQSPERTVVLLAEGEHHATIEAVEWLRDSQGARLRFLPLDTDGVLPLKQLRVALEELGPERVALVSFLFANNEVGSVLPVAQLATVCREFGVPVHVDAVAALGQSPIDFTALGVTALSVSAHKIGGPVGVGALLLTRDARIDPLMHGGEQQRARSGTQNVAGAVGFAAALDYAYGIGASVGAAAAAPGDMFVSRIARLAALRDRLIAGVLAAVPDAVLRGAHPQTPGARLPGNAYFTFPGCQGDSLVYLLDRAGVSVSVGSACRAGVAEVSHVLLAMGVPAAEAAGGLRFTLSPDTPDAAITTLIKVLPEAVRRARLAGLS